MAMKLSRIVLKGKRTPVVRLMSKNCPQQDHGTGGGNNQTDNGNGGLCRDMHGWHDRGDRGFQSVVMKADVETK